MPELPEVEIVCRNLAEMILPGEVVIGWNFYRQDLRFKIPKKELIAIVNQPLVQINRRAKYILLEFENDIVISHLGMTGAWRRESTGWKKVKHDHLSFTLKNGAHFVYNDPRRFGFVEVVKRRDLIKRFADLGVEPLDKKTDFKELTIKFRDLASPIKTALMNQKLIVGVGNIYASEILFAAQVSPLKKASKVTEIQYGKIWKETKRILSAAIESGGSTIENYKNSYGESGEFQKKFNVYARESELCRNCHNPIKQKTMAGRSTFWCSYCQK